MKSILKSSLRGVTVFSAVTLLSFAPVDLQAGKWWCGFGLPCLKGNPENMPDIYAKDRSKVEEDRQPVTKKRAQTISHIDDRYRYQSLEYNKARWDRYDDIEDIEPGKSETQNQ